VPNNEWGDFQTPQDLARQVVSLFAGERWRRVLEPTCGIGRFLEASRILGKDIERQGIEIQPEYVSATTSSGFQVRRANIFDVDLAADIQWDNSGPMLVVGNPPWVTNAELSILGSSNLPRKSNVRKLNGLDSMTGASNFDIAESILLKLKTELEPERPTLAFLVKAHVARNVLSYAAQFKMPYSGFQMRLIDAKAWFNANVDACLFIARHDTNPSYECEIYSNLDSPEPVRVMEVIAGHLVADTAKYRSSHAVDGSSPVEWRSGIKHDAASVMEMSLDKSRELGLEAPYVFPLLKCSDLFRGRLTPSKCVIVPQRRLGQSTHHLQYNAPRLWAYLEQHAEALDARRSSIYRGQPRFAVFGLGDYTFRRISEQHACLSEGVLS